MTAKGHFGPQRTTRAHPVLFSEGEEDTVEAQVGDLELAAGAQEEAISSMFHQAGNIQEEETDLVVRPKTGTASTPRDDKDNVVMGQEFLTEMRDFMRQQQINEKILFDELHDLKSTIFQKPRNEWGFEEQVSQHTHHPLPTPRTSHPPPLRGMMYSPQAHPVVDSIQAISQSPVVPYRRYHEPRIPDFIEGEDVESFLIRFECIARTWGW